MCITSNRGKKTKKKDLKKNKKQLKEKNPKMV